MPDECMDVQTCLAWKIICSSPTSFVMLVLRSPFSFSTRGDVALVALANAAVAPESVTIEP